jgi:Bifunctional DNA primase/polymerase, N-terminal
MEQLPDRPELFGWAEEYARLGLPIIPLVGKRPAIRDWQLFQTTPVNLRYWFGVRGCNVGLRTGEDVGGRGGYVVVDTDTTEAEEWVVNHLPESPMQALSGNGSRHRFYGTPPRKEIRNRQGWKRIRGLDVRGWGGFIVVCPSVHPETGKRYEWLTAFHDPQGLPAFSPSWVYERRKGVKSAVADLLDPHGLVRRGRAYAEALPKAESGKNGHTTTFVACLKLVRFARFQPELAWQLIRHYNATRCEPPWDEETELRHKWLDALKLARD